MSKLTKLRFSFFHFLGHTPATYLLHLSYSFVYKAIRLILSRPGITIWARNSFQAQNYLPGISDIDLTILFDCSYSDAQFILKKYARLKMFFPILGESNVYWQKAITQFLPASNFFELSRDPILAQQYIKRTISTEQVTVQAFVFLLRQLDADYEKLSINAHVRQHKWKNLLHLISAQFPALGCSNEQIDVNFLIDLMNRFVPSAPKDDLHSLFNKNQSPQTLIFCALAPQRWAIHAIKTSFFKTVPLQLPSLDEMLQAVCLEQIAWEIWGLFGQFCNINDTQSISKHMKHMQYILSQLKFSCSKWTEEKEIIMQLTQKLGTLSICS